MVKNNYGIHNIVIECKARCFCPLGNDWYTNQFDIDFIPDQLIPDYCEVDRWITENINGENMIIEEAAFKIHEYLIDKYEPRYVTVRSVVEDAAHSKVTVTI